MNKTDLTSEQIRERYNAQAGVYQSRYKGLKGDYYRRFEDQIFLDFLDVGGKRVLDLGTGRGRLALVLADRAREVVGVDLSDEMIRYASEAAVGTSNLHFEVGDASKLRFADRSFECVSSVGMFPYVRDVQPFFAEIRRVLTDEGTFAFSIANAGEWKVTARAEIAAREAFARWRGRGLPHIDLDDTPLIPHHVKDLSQQLRIAGFELLDYRSTFFYIPSRMFYAAGRRGLVTLQRAAAAANDVLGKFIATRQHGKVVVLRARKARER